MGVFEQAPKQKAIMNAMVGSLLLGCGIFAILLIATAGRLSSTTGSVVGRIGPLELFRLIKTPIGNGYSGSLALSSKGTLMYCALWLSFSFGLALVRLRSKK
jgi:hypothetical protein